MSDADLPPVIAAWVRQDQINLAWAGGFIDGEGCIGVYRQRRGEAWKYRMSLSVVNTDPGSIDFLQRLFGGAVRRKSHANPRWRDAYEWSAFNGHAEVVLRSLLPYLRVKRSQAEAAIAFREIAGRQPGGRPSDEIESLRERAYVELRGAKR